MVMDLPPPPPVLFETNGTLICDARRQDTDEQAIRAAIRRGIPLPRYVVVRRVGEGPKVYEVLGEGRVITLDKEETARLGG
jgi:hypothetical protein